MSFTLAAASWVGSVPTWALLFVALLVARNVTKGGGGAAVSELSRANEVLDKRNHELGSEVRDLTVKVEALSRETNYAASLREHEQRALASVAALIDAHEQHSQERHSADLKLFALIADRLGSEEEWNGEDRRGGDR